MGEKVWRSKKPPLHGLRGTRRRQTFFGGNSSKNTYMMGDEEEDEDDKSVIMNEVMSLFTGMGGLDMGFAHDVCVHKNSVEASFIEKPHPTIPDFVMLKRQPFNIVFQNDNDPFAKHLADQNSNNGDIYHLKCIKELLADTDFLFPAADVVIGGFPCTDFSNSGKKLGFDAERGRLYEAFVKVVERVKPKVFVAENVRGLLKIRQSKPIDVIVKSFEDAGYTVKYELVKCEEHGIPQKRHRVVIIGVRNDLVPKLPNDDWNKLDFNKKQCEVKHYFQHLREPEESDDVAQQKLSKSKVVPNWNEGNREVDLNGFAPTVRTNAGNNPDFRRKTNGKNEHDLPQRRLTLREVALLQTFAPDTIVTNAKRPSLRSYIPIGNAVPPLLGYLIAEKVKQIINMVAI